MSRAPSAGFAGPRRRAPGARPAAGGVRAHRSAVLIVRGEAGVGKTALLQYCAQQASGFRVARVTGVESEMELPFAGLHQLCAPMLDRLDALPDTAAGRRSRVALGLALRRPARPLPGRARGAEPPRRGRRRAPAAVPRRRRPVARRRLGAGARLRRPAAARRVGGDRVRRPRPAPTTRELAGLPELELGALAGRGRARAARHRHPRPARRARPRPSRRRDARQPAGHPRAAAGAGGDAAAGRRSASRDRTSCRDGSSRASCGGSRRCPTMRGCCCSSPRRSRSTTRCCSGARPSGSASSDSIGRPRRRGCSTIGERVRFLHPLVRSAVYRSASPQRAPGGAPRAGRGDRRGRRRGPSRMAPGARPRPGPTRTSRPSSSAPPAGRRRAAGSPRRRRSCGGRSPSRAIPSGASSARSRPRRRACRPGGSTRAVELLAAAEVARARRARPGPRRAAARRARLRPGPRQRGPAAAAARGAARSSALDARLARDTYLDAWGAALFAGRLASDGGLHDVSARRDRRAPPPDDRRAPARPAARRLRARLHRRAARPPGRCCATRPPRSPARTSRSEEVLRWGWLATAAAVFVWDHDTCLAVSTRAVQLARDAGALEVLVVAVNVLGPGRGARRRLRGGDRSLIAEADAITEATGASVAPYGALVLAALRGREAEALELIAATIRDATARRPGHRRPVRALGAGGAHERAVPLRRGARGGGHRRARTRRSCSSPCGR